MKDVLISSTMSMSDDSFASESLTTECVLSSNEISYSLKSLIDIEAADYSFIDEVIAQIVCDQLQIELLTLIKAKSIREFDDHYAKKLITHVIYSNLTVQDYMIVLGHGPGWDRNYGGIKRSSQHGGPWPSEVMVTC